MQPIRLTATVLTVATLVAAASAAGAADSPPDGTSARPPGDATAPAADGQAVTLLTGDRVIVRSGPDGVEGVTVEPGPDRAGVVFTQQRTADGAISVIPADAIEDVAEGRLDARLFDVTTLLEQGYDDASAAELPPLPPADEAAVPAAEADTFDLTVEAIDRDGQPASVVVNVNDPATGTRHEVPVAGEPETVPLPAGLYDVTATIYTPDPDPRFGTVALVAVPEVDLDEDLTLTLDARDAQLLEAEVDSPAADANQRVAWLDAAGFSAGMEASHDRDQLYVTPTAEVTAYDYTFSYSTSLVEPEPTDGSPARGYFLHLPFDGRVPEPPFQVHDEDLAQVDSSLHHSPGRPDDARAFMYAVVDAPERTTTLGLVIPSPGERIDLYSAGPSWQTRIDSLGFRETEEPGRHTYEAGQQYERSWNAAPFGPVAQPRFEAHLDGLNARIEPVTSSEPGHTSSMARDGEEQETTTLSKDGTVVGTNTGPFDNVFAVEPDDADWELTYSLTRTFEPLATQVDASWTVSAGPDENGYLPFVSLRISGDVDLRNRAPAGEPFPVRLVLERADGALPEPAGGTLEVSYDDGDTWQPAPVQLAGGELTALVPAPPAGAEYASLRASAEDTAGAAVEQTVIRAYQVAESAEPTASPTATATATPSPSPTGEPLPDTGAGGGSAMVVLGLGLLAGAALLYRYRRGVAA